MDIIIPQLLESYNDYILRILNSRENIKSNNEYQERHHIVPKCMGGEDTEDNLIYLYAQEHYYSHKLLALEHEDVPALQYAWWNMCHCRKANQKDRVYEVSAEDYAEARERFAKEISSNLSGENAYWYGKTQSAESKRKRSVSESGEKNPMYGKHHTQEVKEYISKLNKGKRTGKDHPRAKAVICINTGEKFDTVTNAAKKYGIYNSSISQCCKGKTQSAGKDPITLDPLKWAYIE